MAGENYFRNSSMSLKVTGNTLEKPGLVIIGLMKENSSHFLISLVMIHDFFWDRNPC